MRIERRLTPANRGVTRRGRFVAAVTPAVVLALLAAGAAPGWSAAVAVHDRGAGAFARSRRLAPVRPRPVPAAGAPATPVATGSGGLTAVRALAAGEDQTCALVGAGGVDCWGSNVYGQLGDGTSRGPQSCNGDPCSSTPVAVRGIAGASAIAVGDGESCALLAGGRVDCWGSNVHGQLGDGTSRGPQSCDGEPCSSTPVAVEGIAGASAVAVGGGEGCALVAGGKVDCWGSNVHGQLGDGTSRGPQSCDGEPCSSTPVVVEGIAGASAIAVGGEASCALLAGGSVSCWGENAYGQLGDGTSRGPQNCEGDPCAGTPVAVEGVAGATAIAAGSDHACALLAGGGVDCWGYNFAAELGIGTSSGVQVCTGGEWCSTKPVAVFGLATATSIVAGGDHTCVLLAGGRAQCWGYNSYGQLGDGLSSGPQVCYWQLVQCAKTPVAVSSIASVSALSAGGEHTCALLGDGSVSCWGANWFGDLGDGARSGPQVCNGYPCSATPVVVSRLPP
jgi:alpha-tubulin suppressor-like RCC1 family protein